jgi:hypothetical protein
LEEEKGSDIIFCNDDNTIRGCIETESKLDKCKTTGISIDFSEMMLSEKFQYYVNSIDQVQILDNQCNFTNRKYNFYEDCEIQLRRRIRNDQIKLEELETFEKTHDKKNILVQDLYLAEKEKILFSSLRGGESLEKLKSFLDTLVLILKENQSMPI